MVLHNADTICNGTAAVWQLPLGHPQRTVVKGNLSSGQNFEQCTWLFILLGRRNGPMCNFTPTNGLLPMVWLDSQGLKGTWLKNWWQGSLVHKDVFGKDIKNRPLWMGKKRWRHLCLTWMLTKGWAQQRRILITKWTEWSLLQIPVSLLLQSTPSSPRGLMNKMVMVVGTKVTHGLPRAKTELATIPIDAQSDSSRDQHWVPSMMPNPRVTSQLPGGRLTTLDCFH